MFLKRFFAAWLILIGMTFAVDGAIAKEDLLPEPTLDENGLHQQPWFLTSFLDLRDDLEEATASGKRLAIIWEQRGCPYCRETHMVNFRDREIVDFITRNFEVIQLNLWGDREVTDFDGEVTTEKKLARKHRVIYTPTIQFFPETLEGVTDARKVEVARMPGYFKPFHFLTMFEYVKDKAYGKQHFQRYLIAKGKRMRAEGKEVKLW